MQYTVLGAGVESRAFLKGTGVERCAFLKGNGARAVMKNYKEPEQVKKLKTAPSSRDPELDL